MPTGIELTVAFHYNVLGTLTQFVELLQRELYLVCCADDADEVVHDLLEVLLQQVGVLGIGAVLGTEGANRPLRRSVDVGLVDRRPTRAEGVDVRRRSEAGPATEHEQVGQRVTAQPVRAVHATGDLTGGEQTAHRGYRCVRVDLHATHYVVAGRSDLHGFGGDVDVGQFLELVIHRGKSLGDDRSRQPGRDVEQHAAMRRSTAGLDFGVDRACNLVTR